MWSRKEFLRKTLKSRHTDLFLSVCFHRITYRSSGDDLGEFTTVFKNGRKGHYSPKSEEDQKRVKKDSKRHNGSHEPYSYQSVTASNYNLPPDLQETQARSHTSKF